MSKGRRGNGEGTIRQRADGRWEGRIRMKDGSRKSYYGASRAEVWAKMVEALHAMAPERSGA
jgi:hypothetical protein